MTETARASAGLSPLALVQSVVAARRWLDATRRNAIEVQAEATPSQVMDSLQIGVALVRQHRPSEARAWLSAAAPAAALGQLATVGGMLVNAAYLGEGEVALRLGAVGGDANPGRYGRWTPPNAWTSCEQSAGQQGVKSDRSISRVPKHEPVFCVRADSRQ